MQNLVYKKPQQNNYEYVANTLPSGENIRTYSHQKPKYRLAPVDKVEYMVKAKYNSTNKWHDKTTKAIKVDLYHPDSDSSFNLSDKGVGAKCKDNF